MAKQIEMFKGTRSLSAPRLCDSCENGIVLRGPTEGDEQVYCNWMETQVSMRVVECNRYSDRAQPSLWEMRRIAWTLNNNNKPRIGFPPSSEWTDEIPEKE